MRLNKDIYEHNTWDIRQIQDRANEMVTIFCKIWPSAEDFATEFPYSEQDYAQQNELPHVDPYTLMKYNIVHLLLNHCPLAQPFDSLHPLAVTILDRDFYGFAIPREYTH